MLRAANGGGGGGGAHKLLRLQQRDVWEADAVTGPIKRQEASIFT